MIVMKFNGVEITQESIDKTVQHFIDIHQNCIDDVRLGIAVVNDPEKYIKDENKYIERLVNGESRTSLTFAQRAYWIQTGEMIALLP